MTRIPDRRSPRYTPPVRTEEEALAYLEANRGIPVEDPLRPIDEAFARVLANLPKLDGAE